MESDNFRKEGPVIAFLQAVWLKWCVAEGALQHFESMGVWESSIADDSKPSYLSHLHLHWELSGHPRTELVDSADCCKSSPVYFLQVNTSVLSRCHHLISIVRCSLKYAETHQPFFCFPHVDLEADLLPPVPKGLKPLLYPVSSPPVVRLMIAETSESFCWWQVSVLYENSAVERSKRNGARIVPRSCNMDSIMPSKSFLNYFYRKVSPVFWVRISSHFLDEISIKYRPKWCIYLGQDTFSNQKWLHFWWLLL